MKQAPVHRIDSFKHDHHDHEFYVNTLERHIKAYAFIDAAHKHDFYVCVMFTAGSGTHTIDFKKYPVKPGAVFFLGPGQLHNWKLSAGTKGFIFFHSASFFELHYQQLQVHDFPFYNSIYQQPVLYLNAAQQKTVAALMKTLQEEETASGLMSKEKRCALVSLIYIELSRLYHPAKNKVAGNNGYMDKLRKLETLIGTQFKQEKAPSYYAGQMGVTRKHLNRISQECLGKTVSEMIADRVILEAKRLLVQGGLSVGEVADALGYYDHSYFNRFFKRHAGETPTAFMQV